MKILLDQGLPRGAGDLLRHAGIDTVHTAECGLACAKDRDVLAYAKNEGRVVVSLDSDFHTLLALSKATAPSVIRIRIEGLQAQAACNLIRHVVTQCEADVTAGCVVSVQEDRVRIRMLPLAP